MPAVQTPERQSESLPHPPVAHAGAQPGGAHLPLWQLFEPQSGLPPQTDPVAQACCAAHARGWHVPAVQTAERQSELLPHPPVAHAGAQPGGPHLPSWQLFEAQSAAPPQTDPVTQAFCAAHARGWHVPAVQTPERQSELLPHPPVAHAGAQPGGAHLPPWQLFEAQSAAPPQTDPVAQVCCGAHARVWQVPPSQIPERQSELLRHPPPAHAGAQPAGPHLPLVHLPDVQFVPIVHVVSRHTTWTLVTLASAIVPLPFRTLQTCGGVIGWVPTVTE